jgi:hypothetical protein
MEKCAIQNTHLLEEKGKKPVVISVLHTEKSPAKDLSHLRAADMVEERLHQQI